MDQLFPRTFQGHFFETFQHDFLEGGGLRGRCAAVNYTPSKLFSVAFSKTKVCANIVIGLARPELTELEAPRRLGWEIDDEIKYILVVRSTTAYGRLILSLRPSVRPSVRSCVCLSRGGWPRAVQAQRHRRLLSMRSSATGRTAAYYVGTQRRHAFLLVEGFS